MPTRDLYTETFPQPTDCVTPGADGVQETSKTLDSRYKHAGMTSGNHGPCILWSSLRVACFAL